MKWQPLLACLMTNVETVTSTETITGATIGKLNGHQKPRQNLVFLGCTWSHLKTPEATD